MCLWVLSPESPDMLCRRGLPRGGTIWPPLPLFSLSHPAHRQEKLLQTRSWCPLTVPPASRQPTGTNGVSAGLFIAGIALSGSGAPSSGCSHRGAETGNSKETFYLKAPCWTTAVLLDISKKRFYFSPCGINNMVILFYGYNIRNTNILVLVFL